MTPNSEQVIHSIEMLPAVEKKKVFEWVETYKSRESGNGASDEAIKARLFERLMKDGLMSEIAPGLTDEEDDEIQPIEIGGEPLSEMIIRERN